MPNAPHIIEEIRTPLETLSALARGCIEELSRKNDAESVTKRTEYLRVLAWIEEQKRCKYCKSELVTFCQDCEDV